MEESPKTVTILVALQIKDEECHPTKVLSALISNLLPIGLGTELVLGIGIETNVNWRVKQ
jgi:hypothetical protein